MPGEGLSTSPLHHLESSLRRGCSQLLPAPAPEVAASFIEFCYKPMLVGRDPFDAEVLWEELYNRTRPFGGGGPFRNGSMVCRLQVSCSG